MTAIAMTERRLFIGADPRRRRRVPAELNNRRGDPVSNLACRITFRPEPPVAPSVELLTVMCILKEQPSSRLPRSVDENLRASA